MFSARTATTLRSDGDDLVATLDDGSELRAGAVVVATGVSYRRMGVERVEALVGLVFFYGSGTSEARAVEGHRAGAFLSPAGAHPRDPPRCTSPGTLLEATLLVRGGSIAETMSDYLVQEIATRTLLTSA